MTGTVTNWIAAKNVPAIDGKKEAEEVRRDLRDHTSALAQGYLGDAEFFKEYLDDIDADTRRV